MPSFDVTNPIDARLQSKRERKWEPPINHHTGCTPSLKIDWPHRYPSPARSRGHASSPAPPQGFDSSSQVVPPGEVSNIQTEIWGFWKPGTGDSNIDHAYQTKSRQNFGPESDSLATYDRKSFDKNLGNIWPYSVLKISYWIFDLTKPIVGRTTPRSRVWPKIVIFILWVTSLRSLKVCGCSFIGDNCS